MEKFLAIALMAACGAAAAQTPAVNRMPDGSRDLYVGLGVLSAPRFEGARAHRVTALPVLQLELSNGIFISGMSAGMHLSGAPSVEYGPLVALQPRRSASGTESGVGGVDIVMYPGVAAPSLGVGRHSATAGRLDGMDPIGARLQLGGFFNMYLSPHLRLTNNLLYGSGNDRNGATWRIDLQRLASQPSPRHAVSLAAGLTVANRAGNQAFFGVSPAESARSGYAAYEASAGLKDVHLGARWNWALAPSWIVTSHLQATRLVGSAKDSPLVERPTSLTVSTALAYRF